MPLYLYNGVLLRAGSALATSSNCCCNQNKCCLLGECFDNISTEFCTAMGGYISTGDCAAPGTTPTTGACVCNPSTAVGARVNCCVDGQVFYSGTGDYPDSGDLVLSECDCRSVGGTVYTGGPCTGGCNMDDASAPTTAGIICLPDGTCLTVCSSSGCDIQTKGDLCLYTYIGGVFVAGGTCPGSCTGAVNPATNNLTCAPGQKCLCHYIFVNNSNGRTYCPTSVGCVDQKTRDTTEYWNTPLSGCKKFAYSKNTFSTAGYDCGGNYGHRWSICVKKCTCVSNATPCPDGTSKGRISVGSPCTPSSGSSLSPIYGCSSPSGICTGT